MILSQGPVIPPAPETWTPTAVMIVFAFCVMLLATVAIPAIIALVKALEALKIASKVQGTVEAQQGSIGRLSETNRQQAGQIAAINRELPANVQIPSTTVPQREPSGMSSVSGESRNP